MALFELNSETSGELKTAYQLAKRLSETTAIQDLAEVATVADALEKITIGYSADPFDGNEFVISELEEQHFFVQIYAEPDEGFISGLGRDAMGNPREGGVFRVFLWRKVRDSEDRQDAYNFFWDRISAFPCKLLPNAENPDPGSPINRNRFQQINRMIGPEFGSRVKKAGQGDFLFAILTFTWGDIARE